MTTRSKATKETEVIGIAPVYLLDWTQYASYESFIQMSKKYANRLCLDAGTFVNVLCGQTPVRFNVVVKTESGLLETGTGNGKNILPIELDNGIKSDAPKHTNQWVMSKYRESLGTICWCSAWYASATYHSGMTGSNTTSPHNAIRATAALLLMREFGLSFSEFEQYDKDKLPYKVTNDSVVAYLTSLTRLLSGYESVWINSDRLRNSYPDKRTSGGIKATQPAIESVDEKSGRLVF